MAQRIPSLLNPVGEFVAMEHRGRRLLGEVVSTYANNKLAIVKHFNGDLWPVRPLVQSLEWIAQEWQS